MWGMPINWRGNKNPSATKKGPGRYHKQGHRKGASYGA